MDKTNEIFKVISHVIDNVFLANLKNKRFSWKGMDQVLKWYMHMGIPPIPL